MFRRSKTLNRTVLSVTPLEDRCVPAGMIDIHYGNGYLEILGDDHANHVKVEKLSFAQTRVSSHSGPIRVVDRFTGEVVITTEPVILSGSALAVQTGNGEDDIELINTSAGSGFYHWDEVGIDSGNGDDRVLIDGLKIMSLFVGTGNGSDRFSLSDCTHDFFDPINTLIDTGSGNDHVSIAGATDLLLSIWLGAGNDVLEGDSTGQMPQPGSTSVDPGSGHDRLLHPDYFQFASPPWFVFEEID